MQLQHTPRRRNFKPLCFVRRLQTTALLPEAIELLACNAPGADIGLLMMQSSFAPTATNALVFSKQILRIA